MNYLFSLAFVITFAITKATIIAVSSSVTLNVSITHNNNLLSFVFLVL